MGQTPNKTYKAPDGTVYRVEDDGSVTKIRGGRIQTNEPPSKYQITPDGKIYRVESDGSVTYLGNAEERQSPQYYAPTTDTKKSSHKWGWVIMITVVIIAVCISLFIYNQMSYSYNDYDVTTERIVANDSIYFDEYSQSTDYTQSQVEEYSQETSADENAQWAFIEDGNFYGTIGNSRIHGTLNLATENPTGTLYYTDNGNGSALDIYGSSDGKNWSEYYNDTNTGSIDFYFWDRAYKNFARGTYTRHSDGKQFSIKLYKSNF